MTLPAPEQHAFSYIEQVDELTRELGWPTEYRQLEPGPFSSSFVLLEDGFWFLMEEQSSQSVEVQSPAPEKMFIIALFEGPPGAVNAQLINSNRLFIQAPGSEFRATLTKGMTVTQIGIEAEKFEEMAQILASGLSASLIGAKTVPADSRKLANLRLAMRNALHTPAARGALQEERIAGIIAGIANAMIDPTVSTPGKQIHREGARRVLMRAMDYIESHVGETIRISSLCDYAVTTPRSLERIFIRELGTSPQQYVKARRLNTAHRQLLSSNRDQGVKVSAIASSCGFTHMGRFSEDYKRFFGHSPLQTLLNG